jgi:hypothetical protein
MDFIRWLILDKCLVFFEEGAFMAALFLNLLIVVLSGAILGNIALTIALVLTCLLWGLPIYVFLELAWKKLRAEFERENGK